MTVVFYVRIECRLIEMKWNVRRNQFSRANKGSDFLISSFKG